MSRKPNQTLLNFVFDHDERYRKLEKHNVSLRDAVQGWHLLRKANLTKEQRQFVTLRAPKMERQKVIEALYLLLGQDYNASHGGHGHHKPFPKAYKYRGYAAQDYETDETFDPIDADGYSEWAEDGAYYGDDGHEAGYDDWDEASSFDANAAYYQYEHEEDATDDSQWQDVDVYDEAYAALHTSTRASASQTFASPEGTCRLSHWAILQLVTSALASLRRHRALRPRRVAKDLRRGNQKVDLQRGSPTTTSSSQHQ